MTIAVLGATGRTGQPLVEELLRRGHDLRVLVRDPARLERAGGDLQVTIGSSTDPVALTALVRGTQAVVSALGPTRRDTALHTRTAALLVDALPAHARFVGVSGAGIRVPGDEKGLRDKAISVVVRTVGGPMAKDKADEYAVLAASDLDWTLVRPPRLVDGSATGRVRHDAHRPGPSTSITRADLAVFLADVLDHRWYMRQAPFVCGG